MCWLLHIDVWVPNFWPFIPLPVIHAVCASIQPALCLNSVIHVRVVIQPAMHISSLIYVVCVVPFTQPYPFAMTLLLYVWPPFIHAYSSILSYMLCVGPQTSLSYSLYVWSHSALYDLWFMRIIKSYLCHKGKVIRHCSFKSKLGILLSTSIRLNDKITYLLLNI